MCAVSFSTFNSAGEESITGTQSTQILCTGYPYRITSIPGTPVARWQKRKPWKNRKRRSVRALQRAGSKRGKRFSSEQVSGTSQHYTGVRDLLREAPAENMDEVFARNVMKQGKKFAMPISTRTLFTLFLVTVLRNSLKEMPDLTQSMSSGNLARIVSIKSDLAQLMAMGGGVGGSSDSS